MKYKHIIPGIFLHRPNRFIAHVLIDGKEEICHVKNTGRCRELLPEGAKVWCEKFNNPKRKTMFDLITVQKGNRMINMDSQAPNAATKEWLVNGGLGDIEQLRAESKMGDSRFDFSFIKDDKKCFLEVKGVTLENDGVCSFPDSPTIRGTKHLRELSSLCAEGYGAYVLFVIQMSDVKYLRPNDETDPAFGIALRQAKASGVQIMAVSCDVTEDTMRITSNVDVIL